MTSKALLFALCAGVSQFAFADLAVAQDKTDEVEGVVVTGSRAASASINGVVIDPMRLPQSVRVLDEALIVDTGVTNLSDLFDFAGGMARQNSFGGAWDAYAIRGFSGDINQGPDLLVNRFTANRGFNARRDVATVERFQVLKGPASALSGKGEPGGSINIVTKAPTETAQGSGELSYGSFDAKRIMGDLSGPLGGGVSARMIAVYQDTDGWRDHVGSDRLLLAPSLAWTPSDDLRLLYQLEANTVHFVHDRGLVAVAGNGKALPRERFLGEPNDGDITQKTLQHQLTTTYNFSPSVAVEAGVQYRDGSFRGQSTHNGALIGTQLRRQLRIHDYTWDDLSGRIEVSFDGKLGGLEHQLRAGADAFTYEQHRIFYRFNPTAATPYAIDILNPVYGQAKPVAPLNQNVLEELRGESLYLQDLVTLNSQFTLLVGVRQDWIRQTNTNYRNNTVTRQSPSQASPRAALTWAPNEAFSAYVSWGRSFRYNQGSDAVGGAFPPEKGEAWEAGVKWDLAGRLTGTASLFRIDKENILVNDPANSGFFIPVGAARSQGFEAETNLRLPKGITATAVYAYTDTEITRDTRTNMIGSSLSNVPKHSGAVYANWRSDGDAPGSVTLGGGVVYVGERAGDDVNTGFKLPDYVTVRANLAYNVSKAVSLHLDVENLFDTYYLESSYSNVWITPGAPRTITGRLRVSF
ncbi:TonB-dependent siderophore receptor [Caulobacter vibrioides]|uniref:TonB-dependent receptor n=2 Tax=Caulobacter vibrioides TaxID=155892 RepID=Q9A847_CAUVC|nr:TonB-dependent siderophore receptor [Caulobacter vibrioides]YP_002516958.1 TonB-dependent receptor [Caulobacter vibrioides NA1000]AAK23496.1 TonB-dependent receptor [Caulobacter vibrioides CB15]ACL95050.1 TonB-dependent receptor [Caulobacter vibrioides NA1000]ATC28320.1 TonB-dependent siderophore receptor [Caulobacter vibrioides]QXZ53587.1 TonB-dependent siderophore receptor [Caulobacter vibrioides]